MSRAEEMWESMSFEAGPHRMRYVSKQMFLAALHEYGQAVRDRDAEICKGMYDKSARENMAHALDCAEAISWEMLP